MSNLDLIFSHPAIKNPLRISTGANEITWGYGLNYQTYPTYGGEVTQILSAYTDDLVIQGDVSSYSKMEEIYEWFLSYIQVASQGGDDGSGRNAFQQTPISFLYVPRGWYQEIIVLELPGFKYGRDVVVPQYQIKAHVVEGNADLNNAIVSAASAAAFGQRGIDLDQFGRVTGDIGYIEENPFSNPFPHLDQTQVDAKTRDLYKQLGDYYGSFITSYSQGDFASATVDYGSVPAFLGGGTGDANGPRNEVGEQIKEKTK